MDVRFADNAALPQGDNAALPGTDSGDESGLALLRASGQLVAVDPAASVDDATNNGVENDRG